MDEYNAVIQKYDKLCETRNDNRFWSENITEASAGITSAIVWQNFYSYLANDAHQYSDKWRSSLGDEIEKGLTVQSGEQTYKTKTVQNGNVTIIRMTPDQNLNVSNKTSDGKQVVVLPERIQEEKSDT